MTVKRKIEIFLFLVSILLPGLLLSIPKILKELWQKTAKKESLAFLNNVNNKLGNSERFHEFIDSQGNFYFRDKNGKLLAIAKDTPFRRPVSAANSEYYYSRVIFLWKEGRKKESVEILKELLSLPLIQKEKNYAIALLYKSKAIKLYNMLLQKYSSRFEKLWNANDIVVTENLIQKEFTIHINPAFFSAKVPASFSLRLRKQQKNREKSLYYFILDSREDYLLKQTEWELKKALEKNLFSMQEYYNYFSGTQILKSELEKFQFQFTGILYRFHSRTPSNIEVFQKLLWNLKGLNCKNNFCHRTSMLRYTYKKRKAVIPGSIHLVYERAVLIRGEKIQLYNEEVFILIKDFAYYFLLESIAENKERARKSFYKFLRKLKINL